MSSDFVMSARSTWLFPPVRGVLPELLLLKGFHRWKLFTLNLMRGKKTSTLIVS